MWVEGAGDQSHGHLNGWRDGVPGPTTIVAQLPEAVGTTAARRLESCSLGLQALLLWAEGWDGRHHLFRSPWFHLLYIFQSPAFRCTNVWNSLVSWCIGQRHLCWVVDVLFIVDWRGEPKGVYHLPFCWLHSCVNSYVWCCLITQIQYMNTFKQISIISQKFLYFRSFIT